MSHRINPRALGLGLAGLFLTATLACAQAPPPADNDRMAQADERIRKLVQGDNLVEAEAVARALVAEIEASYGPDSLETAEALDELVYVLSRTVPGDPDAEALTLATRALAIKERLLGPEHIDVSSTLYHLGWVLRGRAEYERAKAAFERVLAIGERSLGQQPRRPGPAGVDQDRVRNTLNQLGVVLGFLGDYAGAQRCFERSLAIVEKTRGPEHPGVVGPLINLAGVHAERGDYASAWPLMERALAVQQKASGPEHGYVARVQWLYAEMLINAGEYARARPLGERGLSGLEKALGPDHPSVGIALAGFARILEEESDFARARLLRERALAIHEKAIGPIHPQVAEDLLGLADLLRKTGAAAEALPLYERALAIFEQTISPAHPAMARVLNSVAGALAETGERTAAVEAALRAEQVSRDHLLLTARSLSEREALLYGSARVSGLELALTLTLQAEPGEKVSHWKRAVWDAAIRSRALVLDEMAARHRSLAGADDPEVARLAEELVRARERLARLMVRGPGDDSPERYRKLLDDAGQGKEQAERTLAEKSAAFREEQARARLGLDEVLAALPAGSGLVAFTRYGRHELNRKEPSGKPEEPVPSYLAFVLRSGESELVVVPLGPAEPVDGLVARWREQLAHEASAPGRASKRTEAGYRTVAAELRRAVWDPVAPHLDKAKQVFIVPDGALHLMNFAALPVGRASYLIETGPSIHYLSAERDLVLLGSQAANEGLLALGAPAFDETQPFAALAPEGKKPESAQPVQIAALPTFRGNRSACGTFQSMRFESLPASADEAEEIVALWKKRGLGEGQAIAQLRGAGQEGLGSVLYLSGAEATEAAFKQQAPGKRVLHLATHGFFLGGRCASALEPSEKPAGEMPPASLGGENPLLLSGLVFAGANHRQAASPEEDDGVLTAEEIAALDLNGVEWAVLSACDTGVGEVKASEGVFGLRRAFQVAGAHTVIMSLWPVEDKAARQWMATLYEHRFVNGFDTAKSVHGASLDVLRSRRAKGQSTHPFYWAGFVAAGDWR